MRQTERRRKAFGQHFLKSEPVIHGIIERLEIEWRKTPTRRVLEIGPGKGALTLPLLEALNEMNPRPEFFVVEKDRVLANNWKKAFEESSDQVEESDFMDLPIDRWLPGSGDTAVVSNLPYSASTAILGRITDSTFPPSTGKIPFLILMFQKEVADRISAEIGSRESGALTVLTQNAWTVERLMDVPPSAFSPPPDVDSSVLVFRRRTEIPVAEAAKSEKTYSLWNRLVRTAFLQRRKMLRSALRSDPRFVAALEASSVDPTLRAEAVDWPSWKAIFSKLSASVGLIFAALSWTQAPLARANVADAYGLGSRSTALSAATCAWGADAFAAYLNPAQMSMRSESRIQLGWETLWMTHQFEPIAKVVTENTAISDRPSENTVDTGYKDTLGQSIGAVFRIAPEFYNLSFGVVTFLPLANVAYVDSGEPYLPEYFQYRSKTQRPQIDLALGMKMSPWVGFGVGVHFAFALTNQADVFLQTDTAKSSSMRVRSSLKPKLGPYLGWAIAPPETDPGWSLGLVIRFPVKSPIYYELVSGAQALAGRSAVDVNFSAVSVLQYDPLTVELGTSFKFTSGSRTFAQVEYQKWQDFEDPAVKIDACKNKPCGLVIASSRYPARPLRDIFVPKLGHEIQVTDRTSLRLGYAYRPSTLKDPSSDGNNYVDPEKHIFNLGFGWIIPKFMGRDLPARLDLHASYHSLVSQDIVKTSSTEIGAPRYSVGGKIYGGGISLSLDL